MMIEYSALLIQPEEAFFSNVDKALQQAGWAGSRIVPDGGITPPGVAMLIGIDVGDGKPAYGAGAPLLAVISDRADTGFPADLAITPTMSAEALAALFRAWLPPDVAALDRMADLLGREGLLPVVEGLRAELAQALDCIRNGEETPAHRLAGLAGTLGFSALSAAWRAIDAGGGDIDAARRESRITLLALDRWLAGQAVA